MEIAVARIAASWIKEMTNKDFSSNKLTHEEWRDLGFYYEIDDNQKIWLIQGSSNGLLNFAALIEKFSANPRNNKIYEHAHYGPYSYLKIMTWHVPEITKEAIVGKIEDFIKLADLIHDKLSSTNIDEKFTIKEDFSKSSKYSLVFEVKDYNFDPALADPLLSKKE